MHSRVAGRAGVRRILGQGAILVASAWVACAFLWMPTWSTWVLHLVALETALGATVLALFGALVLWPWRRPTLGPQARWPVAVALISIYAPADLAHAHRHPVRPDVVDGPAALEAHLSGTPDTVPERYALASPTTWAARASASLPKTLLVHGNLDRVVSPDHISDALGAIWADG